MGRDPSRGRDASRKRDAAKEARNEIEEIREALHAAEAEEDRIREKLKKLESKIKRDLEDTVADEEKSLADEVDRMDRVSKKALQKVWHDAEDRNEDDLAQKIRAAKADFADRIAEATKRAEEDGKRMTVDDEKELKENSDKRIQTIRDDFERNRELRAARERLATAERQVREEE